MCGGGGFGGGGKIFHCSQWSELYRESLCAEAKTTHRPVVGYQFTSTTKPHLKEPNQRKEPGL